MELGMVGMGRMGANMALRLMAAGHDLIVFDPLPESATPLAGQGARVAECLPAMVQTLRAPRHIWLMLPAGEATERSVQELSTLLQVGDCIVDGGNSHYKDSVTRGHALGDLGIQWLDVGTSGGIWGREEGYCLSIGGHPGAFERMRPVWEALAPGPDRGWAFVGEAGAGHYVKMVHNGIEYALLESYAEGFQLLESGPYDLDLADIAVLWTQGAVIRSWILELAARALQRPGELSSIAPEVAGGETGRWALEAALESEVPFDLTATALFKRYESRHDSLALRLIAALRQEFGGHAVKSAGEENG